MKQRKADTVYAGIHIAVLDGQVYADYDRHWKPVGEPIGAVQGARTSAEALEPTNRRRTSGQRSVDVFNATLLVGPLGILAGLSRKEDRGRIIIRFTNGQVLERTRIGPLWRRGLQDARKFQISAHEQDPVG